MGKELLDCETIAGFDQDRMNFDPMMEIDYIALFVADVHRSLAFYRDGLGFSFSKPATAEGVEGRSGSLRIGLYDRLWLERLFGARGKQPISGYPILLSMSVPDLDATYQQLLAKGIQTLTPPQQMNWGQQLFFLEDPDGNLLEIVQQRSPSEIC